VSEGPEWFAPKRYGLGTGLPIRWQGWALLIGFGALIIAVAFAFKGSPVLAAAIIVPASILFLIVGVKTTRGGWRWRWGDED